MTHFKRPLDPFEFTMDTTVFDLFPILKWILLNSKSTPDPNLCHSALLLSLNGKKKKKLQTRTLPTLLKITRFFCFCLDMKTAK